MAFEDDPYRDEDGEALMDYDDMRSDDEDDQQQRFHQDDELADFNDVEDDVDGGNWEEGEPERERSVSPKGVKKRKKLVKKGGDVSGSMPSEFNDFDEDGGGGGAGADEGGYGDGDELGFEGEGEGVKRMKNKGVMKGGGERKGKEKSFRKEKLSRGGGGGGSGGGGGGGGGKAKLSLKRRKGSGDEGDPEMKEMWDTIAGGADSEEDKDGMRTMDDDNFIDDSGVDPSDRYASDHGGSPSRFAQAEEGEEDEEMKQLFKPGKKKKKNERSAAEIALMVEQLMAEFEVVAEEDAHLNEMGKPAINKLKKLPVLIDALSKKQLQHEFLDHGVLTLLKNWLEPLPDGSLPNINIREAILKILTDFPIDLDQYDRREQLKKSGLGKVIMFLSRSDEETTSNRKLAKDLVDKWSRPIFNKSTRFEDMRNVEDERVYRRPSVKKPSNKASGLGSKDDDLDLREFSSDRKSGQSSTRQLTIRPEATPMDFVIRPQSKIDPDEIRARAKLMHQDERHMKMNKKLQQLKAMKKKKLQATRVSVEGRGMVKYL